MTLKVDNLQNENASEANIVLESTGGISIPNQIQHVGDPDTLIEFETDTVKLQTGGSTRVKVDSGGRVGVGVTNPDAFHNSANQLVVGGGTTNSGITVVAGSTSGASQVWFADGTTGDATHRGMVRYEHNNDALVFKTGGDVERVKLDNAGNVHINNGDLVIGTAGHGIDFSNQTATSATGASTSSEVLDHYEEGTWTPVPRFGGTSHILTGTFSGNYTRIGNKVEARFRLTFSAKGTSTGAFTVEGLPFATDDSLLWTNSGFGFLHRTNLPQTAGQVTADVSGAVINFRLLGQNGGNTTAMDDADLVNTSDIRGSVCYKVAS